MPLGLIQLVMQGNICELEENLIYAINSCDEDRAISIFQQLSDMSNDKKSFFAYNNESFFLQLYDTKSILIISCENKLEKFVLHMLQYTSNNYMPCHKDKFGKTALNYATTNGMKDVVIKLLELENLIKMINY
jgi:ankyrin repeat protein